MKALFRFIEALSVPLVILNFLGGIVSGIWLAILGKWGVIGEGVLLIFVSSILLSFVLMPSLLLAVPAAHFGEKGNTFGLIFFGVLSNAYIMGVITVWCCGMLYLFVSDATSNSRIPLLIWSYGLATGPWGYMASKSLGQGENNPAEFIAVFLAELAYLIIMFMVIFSSITLGQAIKTFASFMFVGLVIQIIMVYLIQREAKENTEQSLELTMGTNRPETKNHKISVRVVVAIIITAIVVSFLTVKTISKNRSTQKLQYEQGVLETLNSYELDKLSLTMATINEKLLTDSDLGSLRITYKSYVNRTGKYFTKKEMAAFVEVMKKSNDYQYELGQSLLFSWDQHKPYTTNRFDELYREMQQDGYRKTNLLQKDMECIQAASKNQSYTEDGNGQKYEFSRELILQGLEEVSIAKKNTDKVVLVLNEFVR